MNALQPADGAGVRAEHLIVVCKELGGIAV